MSNDFFDKGLLDEQATKDKEQDNQTKYDPNPGDVLNGVILDAKAFTGGQYAPTVILTFRNVGDTAVGGVEPGESSFMFTPTVLRRKLLEAKPKVGTPFMLRFEGTVSPENGGNSYKDWTLVTPFTAKGDAAATDLQLWAGIERTMAQGSVVQAPQSNPYGGGQAAPATGADTWKF